MILTLHFKKGDRIEWHPDNFLFKVIESARTEILHDVEREQKTPISMPTTEYIIRETKDLIVDIGEGDRFSVISKPNAHSKELTHEDIGSLKYFWEEKGDYMRYAHAQGLGDHLVEVDKAFKKMKKYQDKVGRLLDNLQPTIAED